MIVKPKIRGFICTTAHPEGCAHHVNLMKKYVESNPVKLTGAPKKVLVIGASTGYGLASRVMASFGAGAETMGVFFEKKPEKNRTATAGWYNSVAFENLAQEANIYTKSFNGDAFSSEIKDQVIEQIKKDWGGVDLVVYSVASPRRQHPTTGKVSRSVLKPLEAPYTNLSINMSTDQLETVTLEPASAEEVEQTVDVMGGDDWSLWINALQKDNLLNEGAVTVAYSYVGPKVTQSVYRNGTIGQAKLHLENTAKKLEKQLESINGKALVSVNKALVTQSSSAIPFIPLYFIVLSKIMKDKDIEEGCIEQIHRLFGERLYTDGKIPVDNDGLVRVDDLELRDDVQTLVDERWELLTQDNLNELTDLKGYHLDFLNLFGFGFDGVDYEADVEVNLNVPTIEE